MATLNDPFGLDPDSTQRLVLTTAETFRLAQQLLETHKGLDEALLARNSAQSKRRRYDRMRVRCPSTDPSFSSCMSALFASDHTYSFELSTLRSGTNTH